jgi:hypothetical protein
MTFSLSPQPFGRATGRPARCRLKVDWPCVMQSPHRSRLILPAHSEAAASRPTTESPMPAGKALDAWFNRARSQLFARREARVPCAALPPDGL